MFRSWHVNRFSNTISITVEWLGSRFLNQKSERVMLVEQYNWFDVPNSCQNCCFYVFKMSLVTKFYLVIFQPYLQSRFFMPIVTFFMKLINFMKLNRFLLLQVLLGQISRHSDEKIIFWQHFEYNNLIIIIR